MGSNKGASSGGPALFSGSHSSSAVWNGLVLQMESAYPLSLNGGDYAAMTINFLVVSRARQLVDKELVVRKQKCPCDPRRRRHSVSGMNGGKCATSNAGVGKQAPHGNAATGRLMKLRITQKIGSLSIRDLIYRALGSTRENRGHQAPRKDVDEMD
ncbi:endonuclease-reverse transcriptase [Danaus plexippus plexippus]|uniref:Endonuclease-reverse transcriptase n=1 Tax=Danaus plexippus plexippus TaxID=278856 RepID=A0A212EHS0_DANPL|nr:endonuclease-reverse transcriptase [Danaus plexippus plexippus]